MKKFLLVTVLIISTFCVSAQLPDPGKQYTDSLLKTGRINSSQAEQLFNKASTRKYPEFNLNTNTGEIEISDILTFSGLEKRTIFQRCLEWIAINYGDLIHNDPETGKIIAYGLLDLNHFEEFESGFIGNKVHQIKTPTNYILVLTIKDNKVKYMITNITYNFPGPPETGELISVPMTLLLPDKIKGLQWIRTFTALDATRDMFYLTLKNSLSNYLNDAENDYKF